MTHDRALQILRDALGPAGLVTREDIESIFRIERRTIEKHEGKLIERCNPRGKAYYERPVVVRYLEKVGIVG